MSPAEDLEALVHHAEIKYITDPARRSLHHWWLEVASERIGFSSFRRRAALARWHERRVEFWADVSNKVLAERADQMASAQVAELTKLAKLRDGLIDRLTEAEPRSLEGVVQAVVALDRRLDEKRSTLRGILPPAEKEETAPQALPFSTEEMRMVAHQLLQLRRAQRRATMGIEED